MFKKLIVAKQNLSLVHSCNIRVTENHILTLIVVEKWPRFRQLGLSRALHRVCLSKTSFRKQDIFWADEVFLEGWEDNLSNCLLPLILYGSSIMN